ncbi:MAG: prolyl-tRNA synthetase associated domain-containing protein [Rhizobiales bacterium]|nr:prolyl-tRNA synthetase associated domain-containing protein [Hyphomicrobiales bacterium]
MNDESLRPSGPASRADLFARLASLGIDTTTRDHPPVHTVEEARALRGAIPGGHCKNLFLKDDKGAIWLIVCLEDARIDLKLAPARIGSRRLTFGKPDLLLDILGVEPGSVTPFGLINDRMARANVILDEPMMREEFLNFHPLRNDATTTIRSADLLVLIRSCGHEPRVVAVSEVSQRGD